MKRIAIIVAAALVAGALIGALVLKRNVSEPAVAMTQPVWSETAWPFPIDQWGKGKAFRCKAGDCSTEVTVYIRAKVGFCNCATGVADDEELDRISDFDLFANRLTALGPGEPITVAWMKGRSRAFSVGSLAFAIFSSSCLSTALSMRLTKKLATLATWEGSPPPAMYFSRPAR